MIIGTRIAEAIVIRVGGRLGIVPAAEVVPNDKDRRGIPVLRLADCIDERRYPLRTRSRSEPAWSEFLHVGVTQLICRRFPFATSVRNWLGWAMTSFFQSDTVVDVSVSLIGAPNSAVAADRQRRSTPRRYLPYPLLDRSNCRYNRPAVPVGT